MTFRPIVRVAPPSCLLLLLLTSCSSLSLQKHPYQNEKLPVDRRVEDLFSRLTPEEKLDLLSSPTALETRPIPRLGIPAIHMAEGVMGLRSWDPHQNVWATAFPAAIAMAATWNPDLLQQEGDIIADEALALGRDQILGPNLNIAYNPLAGANFETWGEDPWLASRMAVAWVSGLQERGVIATLRGYPVSPPLSGRGGVVLTERVLQEIHLPPFQAAVEEAGAWSVLPAANDINGLWTPENPAFLNEVLKKKWGFRGFVLSGPATVRGALPSFTAGLDLESPRNAYTRQNLRPAPQTVIDASVRRILRAMFSIGLFDRERQSGGKVDKPEQQAAARLAATQSIVLLKNDHAVLPLVKGSVHSLAIIGDNAKRNPAGGGHSVVMAGHTSNPLASIRERAGSDFTVEFAEGGEEAVALAKRVDIAIVFAGTGHELENDSTDRPSLTLPNAQDDLIAAVARANPRTIVVLNVGSPVTMEPWLGQVAGLLNAWFPGEEGGHAIADVLFGDANPSGKLPVTFPQADAVMAPVDSLYAGYRHFDKDKLEPLFPFGFGLSYTTFSYSDLRIFPQTPKLGQLIQVMLRIKNTGSRAGAEVVQLYIRDVKSSFERPLRELKAFKRVELGPGESRDIEFSLDRKAISFYDPQLREWVAEPGDFEVFAGASSRDLRLKGGFELFE